MMWNWLCVHCSQVSGKFDSGQRSMYRFQVEQSTSLEIGVPMFLVHSNLEIITFFFFHSFSKPENQMKTSANARRDEICCQLSVCCQASLCCQVLSKHYASVSCQGYPAISRESVLSRTQPPHSSIAFSRYSPTSG